MIWIKIIAIFFAAFFLSAFQYLYKKKSPGLFVLRFFIYLLILLLLIDLSYKKKTEKIIKPRLFVLADQSKSISFSKNDSIEKKLIEEIKNSGLSKKYNIRYFGFGKDLKPLDSINFTSSETDIDKALENLNILYDKDYKAPVIILTDGISTEGKNYASRNAKNALFNYFPVVLGDTVSYANLSIKEINTNPVAFKGNNFPVEIFVQYEGNKPVSSHLKVYQGKKNIYSKRLDFKNSGLKKTTVYLPALHPGHQFYKVEIAPFKNEKNTFDNYKSFAVEIIDQEKNIALISSIVHPDIGLIRRQISRNKYIKTEFFNEVKFPASLAKYDAIILYQPNAKFSRLFMREKMNDKNWFLITGSHTDWRWLNQQGLFFKRKNPSSVQEYFAVPNENFHLFDLPSLSFEKYPPLTDYYGKLDISGADAALYAKIQNITTNEALLAVNKMHKQVVLFGENYWQWGVYATKNHEKEKLDKLMAQIIQYISLKDIKQPVRLDYKSTYYEGEPVIIKARILNKNLSPDLKDQVSINLYKDKKKIFQAPLPLSGNSYSVRMDTLSAGNYYFNVVSKNTGKKKSGSFEVSKINKEQWQTKADVSSLKLLASGSQGKLYFPTDFSLLMEELSKKTNYPSHISASEKEVFLFDLKFLLFLLALLLGLEWLYKKLKGSL